MHASEHQGAYRKMSGLKFTVELGRKEMCFLFIIIASIYVLIIITYESILELKLYRTVLELLYGGAPALELCFQN